MHVFERVFALWYDPRVSGHICSALVRDMDLGKYTADNCRVIVVSACGVHIWKFSRNEPHHRLTTPNSRHRHQQQQPRPNPQHDLSLHRHYNHHRPHQHSQQRSKPACPPNSPQPEPMRTSTRSPTSSHSPVCSPPPQSDIWSSMTCT